MYSGTHKTALWLQFVYIFGLLGTIMIKIWMMTAGQMMESLQLLPQSWVSMPIGVYRLLLIVMLIINSIYLHYMLLYHNLIELRDYRTVIFYGLMHIAMPCSLALSNMIVESIFLYFILPRILVSNTEGKNDNEFMYGFFCGFLSLIYPPLILLLFPLYFIYLVNRDLTFKRAVIPLMGWGLLVVYQWAYAYLTDASMSYAAWNWRWEGEILHTRLVEVICIAACIIIMSIITIQMYAKAGKVVVNRRKKWYVLMINYVLLMLLMILFKDEHHLYLSIWSMVAVTLLSVGIFHFKTKVWNYVLILLYILALYVNFV